MQDSLIVSDANLFLDKYTRFMTKDVYISKRMNEKFLEQYLYLKDELLKDRFLYEEQIDCKKILSIFEKNEKLLGVHNKKYLKRQLTLLEDYFNNIYSYDILDKKKRMMIMAMEDDMLCVIKKNYCSFIVGKIKYLKDILKISSNKIFVLLSDYEDFVSLDKEFSLKEVDGVKCNTLLREKLSTLKKGEVYLDSSSFYQLLLSYIVHLFSDKKRFKDFYDCFSDFIYLNKDYVNFDSFFEYHSYLYQRMFQESGLSLKRFCEREIKVRRGHLKTILNEVVSCKEMVDVANFLYLNSVSYDYDKDDQCFFVNSINENIKISFSEGDIVLDIHDKKYLEKLVYELIKRRFGLCKRSDEEVYCALRDAVSDSYFSDLIHQVFIPFIIHYKNDNHYGVKYFDEKQLKELKILYDYYISYCKEHDIVDDDILSFRVKKKFQDVGYDYVIMLGDMDFSFGKNCLHIIKSYPKMFLLRENIKLMYGYRDYLNANKYLILPDSYLSFGELSSLTDSFISNHLFYFYEKMSEIDRDVCVCFYEEESRLRFSRNLTEVVYHILDGEKGKKILFGFDDLKDIKVLLSYRIYERVDRNTFRGEQGVFHCSLISSIDSNYSVIVLPYVIRDSYHEEVDEFYKLRISIYMALCHCKEKLYLLCPSSKRGKVEELFEGVKRVSYVSF